MLFFTGGMSCISVFLTLLVLLVAVCIGVYFFCETDKNNALCQDIYQGLSEAQKHIERGWVQLQMKVNQGLDKIQQMIDELQK